jgi:hypothetical protein
VYVTFQDFLEPWHSIQVNTNFDNKKKVQQDSTNNLNSTSNPNLIINQTSISKRELFLKQDSIKHSHKEDRFVDIGDHIDESQKEYESRNPIEEPYEHDKVPNEDGEILDEDDEPKDIVDAIDEFHKEDEFANILKLEEEISLFQTKIIDEKPPFRIMPQKQVLITF